MVYDPSSSPSEPFNIQLQSPDGLLQLLLEQESGGILYYSVWQHNRPVLDRSPLGLTTDRWHSEHGLRIQASNTTRSARIMSSLPVNKPRNHTKPTSWFFLLPPTINKCSFAFACSGMRRLPI
ncbi:glycoside hydrolase family 97 N-terminal domain-containing protein [Paenibacillus sp. JCM 10914]|uniref:glycoside hydrolase family 97 N-terminal domain-containing protein n=1 Tax=Paenibacillus sp. JCM 10914 TaxID=1236974 RepID=UPI00068DE277|nr:glycoside hydrolase family 97 N-terminal domain-containing protein [Paenibacillus sp. JCM 10914]